MAKRITTPLDDVVVAGLRAGDQVLLTGVVYTARDAAHKRLVALIEEGKPLPFELAGQLIYYVGPTPAKPGEPIGSAGPTTAGRMDPYAPVLMEHGLKGMIGKGARSKAVRDAMVRHRAVYFAAVGGAGALAAKRIKSAEIVAYEDLGPEAVRKLYVEDFPLFVVNDVYGGDLYEEGVARYRKE
ncbi:MAG: Fe-S-containing hydro-lyase [Firmicutes bacterium]|jgi:fumarate hydratase subunit beta|nr:Fe-S-containing hydro-lyase [Bacillota bacterium]